MLRSIVIRRASVWLTALLGAASLHVATGSPVEIRDCDDCPPLVVIPAGSFIMGTTHVSDEIGEQPAELEPVLVTIERAFAIGRYEITRREFAAFSEATGYAPVGRCRNWDETGQRFRDDENRSWRDPGFPAVLRDDHPVTCVDFFDALEYVEWLSEHTGRTYRLPTEAEWEYAARAGTRTLRFWGDDPFDGCDYANSYDLTARDSYPLGWEPAQCRDGFADLAPVGSLSPNAFGLYDMIGNVWEWIEDCSTHSYVGRPTDQSAWVWDDCVRRIQRGGGWITAPARSRSAYHGDGRGTDRSVFFGFRVARELVDGESAP